MVWNVFRILADCSHLTAKCILIFSIHRNRSAEGVSLLTQMFYALVFVTRYTDIFRERYAWNVFFKAFYLLSSFYTVAIMRFVFPRTREREIAWKMSAAILVGSLVISPFAMLLFEKKVFWAFWVWVWDFSEVLESVCVLPQLLLLRQTTVPTVITSFYIVFLGAYRGLYVLNWIWRALDRDELAAGPNLVSVIFGVVQTALYVDFAWVYWTRQRVKLRNGGVVDADDLRRGWLLNRIFGKHVVGDDEDAAGDEESAPALGGSRGGRGGGSSNGRSARPKWGSRGISISADDGVLEHEHEHGESLEEHGVADVDAEDAQMQDPDELAKVLDDDDDDDDEDTPLGSESRGGPSGVHSGEEWNEV